MTGVHLGEDSVQCHSGHTLCVASRATKSAIRRGERCIISSFTELSLMEMLVEKECVTQTG